MNPTPRGPSRVARLAAAAWLGCALVLCVPPAHAQPVRPWVPATADSLVAWSAEARARFRANAGDSLGGSNLEAYELVGRMGRRLLRSLGPEHTLQAEAIEAVLDSLGLDTEVAIDPKQPKFVLLVARNPFRADAQAVGYLYWYRGLDLRMQGVGLHGGHQPRMAHTSRAKSARRRASTGPCTSST